MPALFCENHHHHQHNWNETSSNETLRALLLSSTPPVNNTNQHHQHVKSIPEEFKFDQCLLDNSNNDAANGGESQQRPPFDNYRRVDWRWTNANDSSHVRLDKDRKLASIHPHCQSACFETHAIMGDKPLKKNALTYWQVRVSNRDNKLTQATSVMVGVGTSKAKLNSIGYLNLIGIDNQSWSLSNTGHIWHDNQPKFYAHPFVVDSHNGNNYHNVVTADCAAAPHKSGGDLVSHVTIGCLYDGYTGQLSFFKNGQCLNVAFANVSASKNDCLFPMISSTMADTQFRLEFVYESQQNLQELCKSQILKSCAQFIAASKPSISSSPTQHHQHHQQHNLPRSIVQFLLN